MWTTVFTHDLPENSAFSHLMAVHAEDEPTSSPFNQGKGICIIWRERNSGPTPQLFHRGTSVLIANYCLNEISVVIAVIQICRKPCRRAWWT